MAPAVGLFDHSRSRLSPRQQRAFVDVLTGTLHTAEDLARRGLTPHDLLRCALCQARPDSLVHRLVECEAVPIQLRPVMPSLSCAPRKWPRRSPSLL